MSTYLITGASRGLGFAFVKKLAQDPKNTVFGLVRDKETTDKKVASELGSPTNLYIIKADITDYEALKATVAEVSRIAGGRLDYIIANAGFIPLWSAWESIDVLGEDPVRLEQEILAAVKVNVIGNIHLFNLFVPLVLKGKGKKVIAISSGMSDIDFISKFEIEPAAPYAVSKAGTSVVAAKFSARYARDGILFMSVCPGSVATGFEGEMTENQTQKALNLGKKFVNYAPNFTGPVPPEDSVRDVLAVMKKATIKAGDGGSFVSHFGNRQWM
ncbi:Fc.00g057210.m01.CDS01 [Cosmosporella sp. VM-42]